MHVIERQDQCIIDCGLAVRFDGSQRLFKKWNAVGEIPLEACRVIEMDNERFVLWVTHPHKRQSCRIEPLFAGLHAAAVVNDQAKADWKIFVFEYRKLLFRLILENAEVFLI